jgi:hypothetical protein
MRTDSAVGAPAGRPEEGAEMGSVCSPSDSNTIHFTGALGAGEQLQSGNHRARMLAHHRPGLAEGGEQLPARCGVAGLSYGERTRTVESKVTTPGAMEVSQPAMNSEGR